MSDYELNINMTAEGPHGARLIKEKLLELAAQIDAPYGKPYQGISCQYHLETKISTPRWDGEEY